MQKLKSIFFLLVLALPARSQEDAKAVYNGNDKYNNGRFPDAAAEYARALKENPANKKANFNLGTAIYKNAKLLQAGKLALPQVQNIPVDSLAGLMYDKSAEQFAIVANSVSNKDTLHRAWHNIGNCFLAKKDYAQAVSAYKKALKYDPKDEETRYNLAYALKHMPPEKKDGGGGSSQQQQQQQDKKDQQKQEKPQNQMSKEQAEQLLKAMMEAEKQQQDKRRQKQEDPSMNKLEKDW